MAISDPRWADLLRFCTIEDYDLELLKESAGVLVHVDEVVTSFYDHILAKPELKSIIERNSSVDRLGQTLKHYLTTLFTGEIDDQRVANVQRIGVVHDRIDLPLGSYIGAILRIDRIMIPALIEMYGDDHAKLGDAIMAYRKILQMDVAMVTQVFIDARDKTEMLVEQMSHQTDGLSNQQEEISGVSETLAAAAQQSHASATELSQTAETITERATGANGQVEECVRLAREGGEVVAATEEAVSGMRTAVDEIASQLAELSEQTRAITGIVKGISEIADQTNLLALNAAIEAARAGEAGRGFAVVADEVRKLADRTHASLGDISSLNKNSLQAIEAVESAMTQTTQQVEAVEQQASSARASFESISGGVDMAAEALGEIVTGIDTVSRSTRDLTSTSQEVAGTAEQLARLAEGLSSSLEDTRQLMESAKRDGGQAE